MPRRQDRFGYGVTIPATTARVSWAALQAQFGGAFLCRPTACAAPTAGWLRLRGCPAGETV